MVETHLAPGRGAVPVAVAATVYDDAFIQVFTVMVSYLQCAAVIIREDDQCYPASPLWGGGGSPL